MQASVIMTRACPFNVAAQCLQKLAALLAGLPDENVEHVIVPSQEFVRALCEKLLHRLDEMRLVVIATFMRQFRQCILIIAHHHSNNSIQLRGAGE